MSEAPDEKENFRKCGSLCIGPACLEDVDRILEIEGQSFSDPWSRQGFEDAMKYDYSTLLAARCDGTVAGYCCLYHIMDEGEIVNVAVAQEFRGRGIGEQMLGELIRQGRLMSVKRFILDVRVGNTAAIRLYEKAGFRRLAIQKNFYENPSEDGWLMELLV